MQSNLRWQKAGQGLWGDGVREPGKDWREGLQKSVKEFGWVIDMFTALILVMVAGSYTYAQARQTVHFKYVQFLVHQLYLNKAVFLKQGSDKSQIQECGHLGCGQARAHAWVGYWWDSSPEVGWWIHGHSLNINNSQVNGIKSGHM